jgi:glycosyltransferase involved in cell wall biosynthesis
MSSPEQLDKEWIPAQELLRDGLLSIILPAHNLGPVIAQNIELVHRTFAGKVPFEVIPVDDGSSDTTAREINKAARLLSGIRPVYLEENSGKGFALRQGFEASRGTHVLFLDADLDLPPHQAPVLFKVMQQEQSDAVIGSKRHPDSELHYPWHRKVTSTVYYQMVRLLFGLSVHDTQTGIKLFRREVLEWSMPRMLVKRFAFDLELLAIADAKGFTVSEAPVTLEFQLRFGCVRPRTVKKVITDTLAIFYRTRILNYYQSIPHTEMPENPPLVSVAVTCSSDSQYLRECLQALEAQTYSNYEIMLLPDEPLKLPPGASQLSEIPSGRVPDFEKQNAAIKKASGSVLAFINETAAPDRNWLKQAVTYFSDPAIGAVGGSQVVSKKDSFWSAVAGLVHSNRLVPQGFNYRYLPPRVMTVKELPSLNFMARRDILAALGGFDPDFWPGQDTKLCLDIRTKEKKRIIYDPRIVVYRHWKRLFCPHLARISQEASLRAGLVKKLPGTFLNPACLLPSLLVIGGAAGAIASVFCKTARPWSVSALLLYLAVCAGFSVKMRPLKWAATTLGVVLTHLVYGIFFIAGLAKKKPALPADQYSNRPENP